MNVEVRFRTGGFESCYPSPPMTNPESSESHGSTARGTGKSSSPRSSSPKSAQGWSATPTMQSASSRGPSSTEPQRANILPPRSNPPTIDTPISQATSIAPSPSSAASSSTTTARPAFRPHVLVSCEPCKKAHVKCQQKRPCERCTKRAIEHECVDVTHKDRGRPPKDPDKARAKAAARSSSSELGSRPRSAVERHVVERHPPYHPPLPRLSAAHTHPEYQPPSSTTTGPPCPGTAHATTAPPSLYQSPATRSSYYPTQPPTSAHHQRPEELFRRGPPPPMRSESLQYSYGASSGQSPSELFDNHRASYYAAPSSSGGLSYRPQSPSRRSSYQQPSSMYARPTMAESRPPTSFRDPDPYRGARPPPPMSHDSRAQAEEERRYLTLPPLGFQAYHPASQLPPPVPSRGQGPGSAYASQPLSATTSRPPPARSSSQRHSYYDQPTGYPRPPSPSQRMYGPVSGHPPRTSSSQWQGGYPASASASMGPDPNPSRSQQAPPSSYRQQQTQQQTQQQPQYQPTQQRRSSAYDPTRESYQSAAPRPGPSQSQSQSQAYSQTQPPSQHSSLTKARKFDERGSSSSESLGSNGERRGPRLGKKSKDEAGGGRPESGSSGRKKGRVGMRIGDIVE